MDEVAKIEHVFYGLSVALDKSIAFSDNCARGGAAPPQQARDHKQRPGFPGNLLK